MALYNSHESTRTVSPPHPSPAGTAQANTTWERKAISTQKQKEAIWNMDIYVTSSIYLSVCLFLSLSLSLSLSLFSYDTWPLRGV